MKRFISLFVSILLSAVALTWFAQNSINAYWQQTYHEAVRLNLYPNTLGGGLVRIGNKKPTNFQTA